MVWAICLLALATSLLPVVSAESEVVPAWSPRILYPHAHTSWDSGQKHEVRWDTSHPSSNIGFSPSLYLYPNNYNQFSNSWHLAGPPNKTEFSLFDGKIEITVPTVSTGLYVLVLNGDGSTSEPFSIFGTLEGGGFDT